MGLEIKGYPFQNVEEDYIIVMPSKAPELLFSLINIFFVTLRIY
jgi:hypothetical protein